MNRRHATGGAAALAAAILLAGCGGGGGGGADAGAATTATPVTPAAAGVSAIPTDSLFGTPDAASDSAVVGSLSGYEEFGTPRDAFDQLVSEDAGGGTVSSEPVTGAPVPTSTAPVVPTAPVTPVTTAPTTTTPTTTAPAVSVMEADFDIGGEPVVAQEGDAIPPGTQQFTVEKISSSAVTLKLNGGLLPSGADTVTLSKGESISLYNQTTSTLYKIRLMEIRKA
ncbi:MAG: hypothetical protein U0237_10845 [Thermoleophilia bacterium]